MLSFKNGNFSCLNLIFILAMIVLIGVIKKKNGPNLFIFYQLHEPLFLIIIIIFCGHGIPGMGKPMQTMHMNP